MSEELEIFPINEADKEVFCYCGGSMEGKGGKS